MSQDELTAANGWALYRHPAFLNRLENLIAEVEEVAARNAAEVQHHPAWKLLECVNSSVKRSVPADPGHKDFMLGNTLGKNLSHWRRVKKGLPQRYRLFFQYRSEAPLTVIYAWLNDEHCLRKAGGKADCYAVFKKLVQSGSVPNSYSDLLSASTTLPAG